jgi:hypothetical protein
MPWYWELGIAPAVSQTGPQEEPLRQQALPSC